MENPSSSPGSPKKSIFVRLLRWLFSWRTLRRFLVIVVALVTLLAVAWTEENWRGKRAWEKYQREWEAKGEKFDLQSFIPPPVPDDQNFAKTPLLAPLFDFNPRPLKPGQSDWRDIKALGKLQTIGVFETPYTDPRSGRRAKRWAEWPTNSSSSWDKSGWIDLAFWAVVLSGKHTIPEYESFSTNRLMAAMEVLRGMDQYAPVLEELRLASQRPYCQFNIRLEEDPQSNLFPHLPVLKNMGGLFRLRALAELASGQSDKALSDTEMVLYLADSIKDEPCLIMNLVRVTILNSSIQPVWEGLVAHQWSEAQLKALQQRLGKIDLLKEYGPAMRGERAYGNGIIDSWLRRRSFRNAFSLTSDVFPTRGLFPSGWVYQNKLALNRMYQPFILESMDGNAHRVYLAKSWTDFERDFQRGSYVYTCFARMLFPAVGKSALKCAYAQASIDEAIVACALERYRLAHGQFPETLDVISPEFIEKIPHDLITGEPLKYHRTEDGQFILYSVGWNEKDDGGKTVLTQGTYGAVDIAKGDWVWRYPTK